MTTLLFQWLFISLAAIAVVYGVHNIEHYGAIAGDSSVEQADRNSAAIIQALTVASSNTSSDREVLVPPGKNYFVRSIWLYHCSNLTFTIRGNLTATNDISTWQEDEYHAYRDVVLFRYCEHLTIQGPGVIDGNGFDFWKGAMSNTLKLRRPHLMQIYSSSDVVIRDLSLRDSPMMFMTLGICNRVLVENVDIKTNIRRQWELQKQNNPLWDMFQKQNWFYTNLILTGIPSLISTLLSPMQGLGLGLGSYHHPTLLHKWLKWWFNLIKTHNLLPDLHQGFPMVPINTDGIDPNGKDFYIRNISIENFDDAVAVKPPSVYWGLCTENVTIEGAKVLFGAGMSIGSIGPSEPTTCIKEVTFRNVEFIYPFKAIYIKVSCIYVYVYIVSFGMFSSFSCIFTYKNIHIHTHNYIYLYISISTCIYLYI